MDLHPIQARPDRRRARRAVDAVLGRRARTAAEPTAARATAAARRHLLLPALHAVQARVGWISPGALNYVCERLHVPPAEAYGVATLLRALLARRARPPVVAHVCDDIACRPRGADALCAELETALGPRGTARSGAWLRSPCLGLCEQAPAACSSPRARRPVRARRSAMPPPSASRRAIAIARRAPIRRAPCCPQAGEPGPAPAPPRRRASTRRASTTTAPTAATRRCGAPLELGPGGRDPRGHRLEARRPRRRRVPDRPQVGGGRAGAGAPALPRLQRRRVRAGHLQGPRADGGRPVRGHRGDDDRRLRHRLPSRATSTSAASTRSPPSGSRTPSPRRARRGLLGDDVMGAGLRASTSRSAAAPAPTSAARRRRSSTRSRASAASRATSRPSPSRSGLFGKPTVRQQRRDAGERARRRSRAARPPTRRSARRARPGTKLFCVSGHVARPGALRGAVRHAARRAARARRRRAAAGRRLQAVLLGGAAGTFVPPDELATPLTFEDTRAHRRHARLRRGHGLRRHGRPLARCSRASPRSSATSRAASACPAASAPCGRRSCSRASRRGGRSARLAAGAAPPRRARPGDARRLDLRPRPDRVERHRVRPSRKLGSSAEAAHEALPVVAAARTVELTVDGAPVSRARGRDAPRRLPAAGIDTPTLCFVENLTPGERLPRLRGRAGGRADARARVLAPGRAGHEGADRLRARAPEPQAGARAARLVGRPLDRARRAPATWSATAPTRRASARGRRRRSRRARRRARRATTTRPTATHARRSRSPSRSTTTSTCATTRKCILCYKCVEACGDRRAEHLRHRRRRPRLRRAHLHRARRPAARLGLRLLRQLHRRLPDRRAHVQERARHARRPAPGTRAEQTRTDTICPYCGVGCTLTLHVQDERDREGDLARSTSTSRNGHLCIKGRFGFAFVQNREGSGQGG